MKQLQDALYFLLVDGTILTGLFILITMLVLVTQQLALGRAIEGRLAGAGLWRGAMLAAVFGTVTPFCSCSTVPVLTGMLRAKIRLAASFTFLIASPVINEGVIVLLAGRHRLSGPEIPAAGDAGAVALGSGAFSTDLLSTGMVSPALLSIFAYVLLAGALCVVAGVLVERSGMMRFVKLAGEAEVLPEGYLGGHDSGRPPLAFIVRTAWAATRMELRQLWPYLATGLLVGALVYGYVPAEQLARLNSVLPPFALIPLVALLAVPVYVSPMAAVPIAFALLEKGMASGAVVAFLIAGAGTSLPEMIMLGRLFRWPLVLTHIAVVVIAAVLLGFAAQLWLPHF